MCRRWVKTHRNIPINHRQARKFSLNFSRPSGIKYTIYIEEKGFLFYIVIKKKADVSGKQGRQGTDLPRQGVVTPDNATFLSRTASDDARRRERRRVENWKKKREIGREGKNRGRGILPIANRTTRRLASTLDVSDAREKDARVTPGSDVPGVTSGRGSGRWGKKKTKNEHAAQEYWPRRLASPWTPSWQQQAGGARAVRDLTATSGYLLRASRHSACCTHTRGNGWSPPTMVMRSLPYIH